MTRFETAIFAGKTVALALLCGAGVLCSVRSQADHRENRQRHTGRHVSVGTLPHGSFVIQQIHNVAELSRHLDTHPAIAQRYARLTNMTPRMVHMALSRLHVTRLAVDTNLEVYYCHVTRHGEVIGFRKRRIPRGATVFAFADGTPAILQACGNPTRALALVQPQPPLEPAVAPAVFTSIALPKPAPLPEAESTAPDSTFDDFEEVPAAELYIPKPPSLPASRLAAYSADNLYEWVRHAPRSANRSAAGFALAGISGLGTALAGGAHGTGLARHPELPLNTVTNVDVGGTFDLTTELGVPVVDGVVPVIPMNPQKPPLNSVLVTTPVGPTIDGPSVDPVATPEFGSVVSLGGLLAAAGAGLWFKRRKTQ